jgi:hypothetical protein
VTPPTINQLRQLAVQEARAIRLLYAAHGRIPPVAPLRNWPETPLRINEPRLPDAGQRNGKQAA